MNIKYTIKNFKTFDKEGAEFDIRPITLLTGCNSSGKSSAVKSILALETFLSAIKNDNEDKRIKLSSFYNYPMHFNVGQLKLGRYDCVLNRESPSDSTMTFGYTIESGLAARKFYVEYVFEASKNIFNDAQLHDIRIFTEDGIKVLDKDGVNILPLRDSFFKKLIFDQQRILEDKINDTIGDKKLSWQDEYDMFNAKFGNTLTAQERYSFSPVYPMSIEEHKESLLTSFELGISILKHHSVYSMPALDALASVSKDNFLSEFEKLTPVKFQGNAEWEKLVRAIADDFRKSEYDTFGTYFRSLEEKTFFNKDIDFKEDSESLDLSISGFLMSQIDKKISDSDIESGTVSFRIIARALYLCSLSYEEFSHSLLIRQDRMGLLLELFNEKPYLLPSLAAFSEYAEKVIHELLLPPFVSNVNYIGSSRAEIKRMYSVDDRGSAFDDLVVEYENQKHLFAFSDNNLEFKPGIFINKWLKNFRIADSMSFKNIGDGAGIMIYLHRDKDDIKGHLLADEGYGITQLISILLGIEISIMKGKNGKFTESRDRHYEQYNSVDFRLFEDYGIPPYEFACPLEGTLLIEEPETHLHPKYQSMLAEMFLDAYTTYNIQFVIETHSEYLIRKFQTFVAKYDGGRILSEIISEADLNRFNGFNREGFAKAFLTTMDRDEISVYYLYKKDEQPEDCPLVKKLELKEDGRLASQFGPGFFDEADNLAMDLLSIKMQKL